MTIKGWAIFGIVTACVIVFTAVAFLFVNENMARSKKRIFTILGVVLVAGSLIIGALAGLHWYYTETAEGRRNGLERTINILNADGEVIRTYTGVIDIEGNDGGYVVFDYNGSRYTYYNCYLESIADIE